MNESSGRVRNVLWIGAVSESECSETDIAEMGGWQLAAENAFPELASVEWHIALASGRSDDKHNGILR